MDFDDDISLFAIPILFLLGVSLPFLVILIVTVCMAWSRTKQWQKEQRDLSTSNSRHDVEEGNNLMSGSSDKTGQDEEDSDDDSSSVDSEDELERRVKADKDEDRYLTTKQKFRKEFRKLWKGNKDEVQAKKIADERKERRKLAKEIARQLVKLQNKKERSGRKADAVGGEGHEERLDGLPSYSHVGGRLDSKK